METETIAGKNIARLVRDRIVGHCPVEKRLKR
jgi:prenylcysteine oxidase/farnesylcysteine lyase